MWPNWSTGGWGCSSKCVFIINFASCGCYLAPCLHQKCVSLFFWYVHITLCMRICDLKHVFYILRLVFFCITTAIVYWALRASKTLLYWTPSETFCVDTYAAAAAVALLPCCSPYTFCVDTALDRHVQQHLFCSASSCQNNVLFWFGASVISCLSKLGFLPVKTIFSTTSNTTAKTPLQPSHESCEGCLCSIYNMFSS